MWCVQCDLDLRSHYGGQSEILKVSFFVSMSGIICACSGWESANESIKIYLFIYLKKGPSRRGGYIGHK